MGLSQRLYIERVKKALFKNLDNRIPAMRVRSRLSERHWKKRHESAAAQRSSKNGRLLVLLAPERSLLTRKRRSSPFRHDLGPGYYDTHYRLPTRQMGWPTLGCNQQDPRRASERLVRCKPARMVPKAGGRAANTAPANYFYSDCRR